MDCSICMEAITKATGSTVLSCEHAFHFRCIDSWFTKQVWDEIAQTCPCCRSAGCETDRCSVQEMDAGEEEDDDETYVDEESQADTNMPDDDELEDIRWERLGPGRWNITTSHEVAMEGFRGLFGPLNELVFEDEKDTQDVAIRKIQAIYRGYKVREPYEAAHTLLSLFNRSY